MRFLVMLISVFLFSSASFAQTYLPMLDTDHQWSNVYSSFFSKTLNSAQITLEPTVEINGQTYYPVQTDFDSGHCYLRETAQGEVYLYNQDQDQEILVLDFDLNVGEIFDNPWTTIQGCDSFFDGGTLEYLLVTDVYTEFIAGANRKVIQFEAYLFGGQPLDLVEYDEKWIEGIGSTKGMLPFYYNWDFYCDLACFTANGETTFFNGFNQCVFVASTSDFAVDRITAFPNPTRATTQIYIPPETGVDAVRLYDAAGMLLFQQPVQSELTPLNLAPFSSGLYLCTVLAGGKIIRTISLSKN